jgi:hypothetical protein
MDPDIISKISNLTADTFFSGLIFVIFYGFLAMIGLVIIGFIFFLILSDPMVSTCFWIIIHICLLSFFSPYFVIILFISVINYLFLATKNAGNIIAANADAAKKAIVKKALDQLESAKKMKENMENSANQKIKDMKDSAKKGMTNIKDSIKDNANKMKDSIKDNANKAQNNKNIMKKVGGGDEEDKSELKKFLEILEKTDYFQLWYYLLYVYTIQNKILKITKDLIQKMQEGVNIMKEFTKMVTNKDNKIK